MLAALYDAQHAALFANLEMVTLDLNHVLYEAGDMIDVVYFPLDCVISLLYMMEDGRSVDTSVVGNEGLVGVAAVLGGKVAPFRAMVQLPGDALRLHVRVLKDAFNRDAKVREILLRYTQSLLIQLGQTAGCNRHHSLEQRLCCWLLYCMDRVSSNNLAMTQELIASNLGVRREGVTAAARKLQKQGVIDYGRGHITVLNRSRLEALSCECHAIVTRETDRLLPAMKSTSTQHLSLR